MRKSTIYIIQAQPYKCVCSVMCMHMHKDSQGHIKLLTFMDHFLFFVSYMPQFSYNTHINFLKFDKKLYFKRKEVPFLEYIIKIKNHTYMSLFPSGTFKEGCIV